MKIGYVMQAGAADMRAKPLSGPANHVKHVCQELTALGHTVEMLLKLDGQIWHTTDLQTFRPIHTPWLEGGPLRLGQRMIRRVQSATHSPYAAFFDALEFAFACRQTLQDCDLLYERMGWMGYGSTLAAQWLRIPLCLEVNGDHLDEMKTLGMAPDGGQKWLSMRLMRWMTGRAAHVITTGDGWRQRFLDRWPVAPGQVTSVENGSEVVTLLRREQLRPFRPLASAEPVKLVYVGGFEKWHGITVLLQALAIAIKQGAPLTLYLLGAGPEQQVIEATIKTLGLQNAVTMTGFVDIVTLSRYLADADIGLCPYCGRVEYSGLKLLDYKAAGLATIASGANGQPVVIKDGQTGMIVPPCDETALAGALLALSRDHTLRRQMGSLARIEAEREHSWRHTAQRLEAIFTQVTVPLRPYQQMKRVDV